MGTASELDTLSSPVVDDEDTEIELDMNDDELLFDDYDEEEDEEVTETESIDSRSGSTPGWRRVEIFRESRLLQSELADFDDYDKFDFQTSQSQASFSP